jgi:hypothetical protein
MFKNIQIQDPRPGCAMYGQAGWRFHPNPLPVKAFGWITLIVPLIALLTGCRTAHPLPPVNLSEPGWTIHEGQALWRANKDAPEIAGELTVATHGGNSSFVQFTKTPVPFIVAQSGSNSWQIHSVPDNRTYSGHGPPPARLFWLQLPRCLAGEPPPKKWRWETLPNDRWHLYSLSTGESLEGYLAP